MQPKQVSILFIIYDYILCHNLIDLFMSQSFCYLPSDTLTQIHQNMTDQEDFETLNFSSPSELLSYIYNKLIEQFCIPYNEVEACQESSHEKDLQLQQIESYFNHNIQWKNLIRSFAYMDSNRGNGLRFDCVKRSFNIPLVTGLPDLFTSNDFLTHSYRIQQVSHMHCIPSSKGKATDLTNLTTAEIATNISQTIFSTEKNTDFNHTTNYTDRNDYTQYIGFIKQIINTYTYNKSVFYLDFDTIFNTTTTTTTSTNNTTSNPPQINSTPVELCIETKICIEILSQWIDIQYKKQDIYIRNNNIYYKCKHYMINICSKHRKLLFFTELMTFILKQLISEPESIAGSTHNYYPFTTTVNTTTTTTTTSTTSTTSSSSSSSSDNDNDNQIPIIIINLLNTNKYSQYLGSIIKICIHSLLFNQRVYIMISGDDDWSEKEIELMISYTRYYGIRITHVPHHINKLDWWY